MDKKSTVVTKKDETALATWKAQDKELRRRRAELMYRLHVNGGLNHRRIAEIYGCKRQFVQQEISKYLMVIA